MPRILSFAALALLMAIPAAAQIQCNLAMTMTCTGGTCTAVTTNNGVNMCTGEYIVALLINDDLNRGSVTNFHTSLGLTECFDTSTLPLGFGFGACIGNASLGPSNSFTMTADINLAGASANDITAITVVDDPVTGTELGFAYVVNNAPAPATCTPTASVPSAIQSGVPYNVTWSAVSQQNATYTVDESTFNDFTANLVSQTTSGLSATFQHTVSTATTYYYRVRAVSCSGAPGTNSATVSTVVQTIPTVTGRSGDATAPLGSTTPVSMKVFIPSPGGKDALDVPFTATTNKPYLTVTPSSGMIPAGGTTVTVSANPAGLPPGANTGTLNVTANGATIATKSVTVSLVTPVTPGSTTLPPSNALVIPAVAHAPGAFGPFQSDVRLTIGSGAATTYQITYRASGTDPARQIKSTSVSIDPGQTIALNDILRDFFGVGATENAGDSGIGALEIRPINSGSNQNYAASRTFTFNDKGTFGQFIAAIPFLQFATKATLVPIPGVPQPTGTPTLSLQQIAQSPKFRTNYGLVEGSGQPASGTVKVFDDRGTLVRAIPYSLQGGEHQQTPLSMQNVGTLDDGRIEVTVESATGAVTAYASVLDNLTNDPLAVTPVQVSQVSSSRYVLPGMAALENAATNFHSDIRIYNGGAAQARVTATFYSQTPNTPPVTFGPFSIEPGGVRAFDDAVATVFNRTNDGGSIVLTTDAPTSMVATGRTYTIDASQNNGTYGQFIPGVMPSQGIGAGDRPLQVLQLEQSTNFRSNLGLAELSGNPATSIQCSGLVSATACVHVTAYLPDSKIAASTDVPLAPNQFIQLNQVLASIYPGQDVYNARISVEVTSGTGRVSAYGSVIDNLSRDPTFVPPQ